MKKNDWERIAKAYINVDKSKISRAEKLLCDLINVSDGEIRKRIINSFPELSPLFRKYKKERYSIK